MLFGRESLSGPHFRKMFSWCVTGNCFPCCPAIFLFQYRFLHIYFLLWDSPGLPFVLLRMFYLWGLGAHSAQVVPLVCFHPFKIFSLESLNVTDLRSCLLGLSSTLDLKLLELCFHLPFVIVLPSLNKKNLCVCLWVFCLHVCLHHTQ